MPLQRLKNRVRWVLLRTGFGFRLIRKLEFKLGPPRGCPEAPWHCAVLKSGDEVKGILEQVRRLGLPPNFERTKNWDSLAALDLILRTTNQRAHVFDAGGDLHSVILPSLFLYGYRNLVAGNLVFDREIRRGSIVYEHSDITRTRFPDGIFDAVTCLSVIEKGVDLEVYFREMSRIIKPGGMLITSTDYYETPVDTRGQTAFGVPIRIFTREDITRALELAARYGISLIEPLDLTAGEKVVHWRDVDLRYTFVIFSLRKGTDKQAA